MSDDKDQDGKVIGIIAILVLAFLMWKLFRKKPVIAEPEKKPEDKHEEKVNPFKGQKVNCENIIYRPLSQWGPVSAALQGKGYCYKGDGSYFDEKKIVFGDKYADEQAQQYADFKMGEALRDINRKSLQIKLQNATDEKITTNIFNTNADVNIFGGLNDTVSAGNFLQDIDGNVYHSVIIGSQEWIIENLRVKHYADGNDIANLTDSSQWAADATGSYSAYDNDEDTYLDEYGLLYNWFAVNHASGLAYLTKGGVQESGWRVATLTDFDTLSSYLTDSVAGNKLKEKGIAHWEWSIVGESATNESGFTGLGAGRRFQTGSFSLLKKLGFFWTATESTATESYYVYLENLAAILDHDGDSDKNAGYSVRLVRDI